MAECPIIISYSVEKKKRLAAKISEMRNKSYLRKIKKIIFDENPDIAVSKNSGGYLMYFQNLKPSTYTELEKYIKKIETKKLSKHTTIVTENSEHAYLDSDEKEVDYAKIRTRYRYSNKEKNLIKRKQYEKIISDRMEPDKQKSTKLNNTKKTKQTKQKKGKKNPIFSKN